MVIVEMKDTNGKIVGVMMAQPKEFRTGSRGFYANAKITLDGKKYQAQVQIVEIGSKQVADKDGALPETTAEGKE